MSEQKVVESLAKVVDPERRQLQEICLKLCPDERERHDFPGSQPVSFERRHLSADDKESLRRTDYYAAEKTDGVRYMLLLLGARGAFMVDRKFNLYRLPATMKFPGRAAPGAAAGAEAPPLDRTLVDGELVEDERKAADGSVERRLRYLVYDATCVCGRSLMREPLPLRLMAVRREVLGPRFAAIGAGELDAAADPFGVELKDFFQLSQLPHIFAHVAPGAEGAKMLFQFDDPLRKLAHGNDGIIFTQISAPYHPGTCRQLLKWKPACMNSVDFKLRTKWRLETGKEGPQARFQIATLSNGALIGYDWISFSPADHERFENDPKADSRILECVYDPEWPTTTYNANDDEERTWDHPAERMGGWKFERLRDDKDTPNAARVVESIKQSVADGVTQEELLELLRPKGPPR